MKLKQEIVWEQEIDVAKVSANDPAFYAHEILMYNHGVRAVVIEGFENVITFTRVQEDE